MVAIKSTKDGQAWFFFKMSKVEWNTPMFTKWNMSMVHVMYIIYYVWFRVIHSCHERNIWHPYCLHRRYFCTQLSRSVQTYSQPNGFMNHFTTTSVPSLLHQTWAKTTEITLKDDTSERSGVPLQTNSWHSADIVDGKLQASPWFAS